jgi:hypothetical protein
VVWFRSLGMTFGVTVRATSAVRVTPRPALPPPAVTPIGARFGDLAMLQGASLSWSGAELTASLVWRAVRDIPESYTAFVQALDREGRVVAQSDQVPAGGLAPTTA